MMRLLDGAEFSYTPFELSGGTLARYLGDLPRGAIVAIGVPARHVPVFAIDRRLPLEAIGFSRRLTPVDAAGGVAVIGARGGPSVDATPDPGGVHVRFETPAAAGAPARPPIAVRVDRDMATIEFGGREIVRTARGMAVAVWTRDGLAQVFAVPAEAPSTPTLPTPYAIYPLRGLRERHAIASDSVDLTGEASTGSFVYKTETGASRLVFYAGRTRPLAPSLLDCSARSWPTFDVREFAAPAGARPDLARALERDGLPFDERLRAAPHVYRVAVDTQWSSAAGVQIGLGGVPDVVFGRLIDGAPGRVHGVDVSTHLARVDERTLSLHMARDHHSQLVGAGWSDVQADAVGPYRETVSREAELLLPIAAAGPLRVGVQLIGLSGTPPGSVQLRVNGQALPDIASIGEWRRYWWDVPASAVTEGVNSLVLTVGPEPARIAVSDILVEGVP
jgi:hypothetical protein